MAVQQNKTANRIPEFDFTKGVLVLFMVLYHWLNYFYSPQGKVYDYLRFLTPSFIFITGFLISYVHISKYGIENPELSKRLFQRGLKLLVVFIFLNILIGAFIPDSSVRTILTGRSSVANLEAIFLSGNVYVGGIGKAAAFTILVPIGYLLMIAALLLLVAKFFKYIFHAVCVVLLISVLILGSFGIRSANLEHLTIGLLGIALGYISRDKIKRLVSHPYAIVLMYCAYLGAITIWEVPFLLRIIGVCLTLMLIYIVGATDREPGIFRRRIILLGKYSLFGYISQIAILQVMHRVLSHFELGIAALAASLCAGILLSTFSVELMDWLRAASSGMDRVYRAVFA